jgi:hypothetical protein
VKIIFSALIRQLIFLTPLGLILNSFKFQSGEKGIALNLSSHTPIKAVVSNNPSNNLRFQWFVDGSASLISVILLIQSKYGGDIGAIYSILAIIYATLCLVSSIQPKFDWNKRGKFIPFTAFEVLVVATFVGIPGFYMN